MFFNVLDGMHTKDNLLMRLQIPIKRYLPQRVKLG